MKAFHIVFSLALSLLVCSACARPCRVVWTEGETNPETKKAIHRMEITGAPAGTDWTLWFCQFRTPVKMQEGADGEIAHLSGTLYRVIPAASRHDGAVVLEYEAKPLVNRCRAPEGFFLQRKGRKACPVEVEYVYQPAEEIHSFEWTPKPTGVFDMIPRLKRVAPAEGTTDASATPAPTFVEGQVPGWYRITLDGAVRIEAADEDGAWYAGVTLENLRRNAGGSVLPNAVIEDWPDLGYRGIMLDVSRNFTNAENLLHLIDVMAHYKASYLHLHLGDDEGWRLEITGLPELTSYGAYRGLPVLQEDGSITEPDALQPTYCGTLDRRAVSSANGYFSCAEFVGILRYAWARRIRVIPEFDTPGHSRAAIKAMEKRFAVTGDATYLLSEAADTSRYVSVQDYTDNAINVALPSTYAFLDKVFEGVVALYQEAGVPLEGIHVGGDEVPEGAWVGSPACRALMAQAGRTDIGWLKDYYVNHVLDVAEARGVKVAGWQELLQHLEPATYDRLKENLAFTNLWAVSHGRDTLAYHFANDGVDVVLSNSSNNYFDLAYNRSKLERGHSWAGFVDERRSFSFLPYEMYRSVRWDDKGRMRRLKHDGEGKPVLTDAGRPHIRGVQGQLWSETLRCFDHVTYYLFPKAAGLFERGWNATPAWQDCLHADDPLFVDDFDRFFSIVADHEYPYYDAQGISYHRN